MTGSVVRGLRRIVDALQRSLFDSVGADPMGAEPTTVAAMPPSLPVPPSARRRQVPVVTRSLLLGSEAVSFQLRRTARRSIGFQVGDGGLAVTAPKWLALRDVDAAVQAKQGWIVARLAAQRERAVQAQASRVVWRDRVEIDYLGAPLRVVLGDAATASGTRATAALLYELDGRRELRIGLPCDAAPERIRDVVHGWLQRQALALFTTRCADFAGRLGVVVRRISLSSATTRWGSASGNGNIRLHWRLIQFPLPTIDYVVAHELAHLREMNHGERFWSVVRSVLPEFAAAREALRQQRLPSLD